ncbi:hypothetical protein GCM10027294_43860 [Marinactinospora endophytica]
MWRFYARRAVGGAWLSDELPLSGVRITHALSGPGGMTATLDPVYRDLLGDDGQPLIQEWGTLIFAEAAGQLRGGGIVTAARITGQRLVLTVDGVTAYAAGMPLTSTLTWGGKTDGVGGQGVDPFTVVRALWDHLQSQPDGGLGVTVSSGSTPYRLGAWHNARRLDSDGSLGDDPAAIQDPPIPIDRVWDPKVDKKPTAARGKSVYWQYQLPWWDDIEVGAKIAELARQVPFDYREHYAWASPARDDVVMEIQLGYPRIGRRQDELVFVEGENVTDLVTVERDGADYANEVRAYGAGEGSKQIRQTVSQRDGRLRRATVVDRPDLADAAALRAVAADELRRANALVDITSFTARDHPNAPIGSWDIGDDVLVHTRRGWAPTTLWVRITAVEIEPASGQITIRCSRSDRFRYGGA